MALRSVSSQDFIASAQQDLSLDQATLLLRRYLRFASARPLALRSERERIVTILAESSSEKVISLAKEIIPGVYSQRELLIRKAPPPIPFSLDELVGALGDLSFVNLSTYPLNVLMRKLYLYIINHRVEERDRDILPKLQLYSLVNFDLTLLIMFAFPIAIRSHDSIFYSLLLDLTRKNHTLHWFLPRMLHFASATGDEELLKEGLNSAKKEDLEAKDFVIMLGNANRSDHRSCLKLILDRCPHHSLTHERVTELLSYEDSVGNLETTKLIKAHSFYAGMPH